MHLIKYFNIFFVLFIIFPVYGNDCLSYKITPKITISSPDWTKTIVQPTTPMDLWHGNVVATLIDDYDITTNINSIDGGYCVSLKSVNATIGYNNFDVQIDIRHTPNTCSYNAILKHEEKHIQTYLSLIESFKSDLHKFVYSASDSIMPIFISEYSEIDDAVTMLNNELQSHPDLILIKQKIMAAQEIENKRIDKNETGYELKKCFE